VRLLQWTDTVWYSTVPLGVNRLSTVVSRLCKMAGFRGYFTLHSLRATAVTRLFAADVDEQLIMAQTGHTSIAVRSYKQFSEQQLQHVSDVVAGRKSVLSDEPLASEPPELSLIPPVSSLSCPSSSTASVSCDTRDTAPDQSGHVLIHDNTGNMTVNILYAYRLLRIIFSQHIIADCFY